MVAATESCGIVMVGMSVDITTVDDQIAAHFISVTANGSVAVAGTTAVTGTFDGSHVLAVALGVDGERVAVLNLNTFFASQRHAVLQNKMRVAVDADAIVGIGVVSVYIVPTREL